MELTRLVLTNYGPYAGQTTFELRTTADSSIVLFGGENGAGKTTLFSAIQICLHGRSAFDESLSRSEYEERMRSLLHESGGTKATESAIRLEFEYGELGQTEEYIVERSFRDRGKSLAEDLTVKRDGSPLSDLEEEQWDDFLKELIPPGISQLFFFDGEKIQQLASAIENDDAFDESLMSLLGLDLVDQLDTDLSIYLSQKLDEEGHADIAAEIEELREQKAAYEAERAELEDDHEATMTRLKKVTEQIEQKEQELAQEGGNFAERRDALKEERAELDARIDAMRDEIRELATDSYPFALAPSLCRGVVEQLEAETEAAQRAAAKEQATDALADLAADEDLWSEAGISPDASSQVVDHLQDALAERLAPDQPPEQQLAAEFSERERQEMRAVVTEALEEVPEKLKTLTDDLEAAIRDRRRVEDQLQRAPDEEVIEPILTKINDLTQERSRLEEEVESIDERLEELETLIDRLESQIENTLEKQQEFEDVSQRADLAGDVRDVIQDYREELIQTKLERLEDALTDRYLQLSNKAQFYDRVTIDRKETTIMVETTTDDQMTQSQLSAGERQIFATALLWALADISDRPLPFIIDTPLGRLDTTHRGNLVENFFPDAAHQVLLFSTDTEITDEYYELLADDLAAEYHLTYDQTMGQTEVAPGYFWTDPADAAQDITKDDLTVPTAIERQVDLGGFENE